MKQPKWLRRETILAVHQKTLREQGGRPGIRDDGLLDSTLSRPVNAFEYMTDPTLFDLAAAYAFGLSSNHPFIDGNKRAAFYASAGFLRINGVHLNATEADAAITFIALAAGEMNEDELASWFRSNSERLKATR